MQFETHERRWRWAALLAVLANISFNLVSERISYGNGSIGEISARYDSLFMPAGFAFGIWGLIYFCTLVYAIHQLMPSQRSAYTHDALVRSVIALNVLAMAWIAAFRFELIALSLAVIAVMLATSLALFLRVTGAVARHEVSKWVLVPATLWFAWLSVATIANASLWTVAMDWTSTVQRPWTLGMISIAALLGLGIGYRYRNGIYPLVIAWASVGIAVARQHDEQMVALAALASALVMLAWSAYSFMRARRARSGWRIFRGPLDVL